MPDQSTNNEAAPMAPQMAPSKSVAEFALPTFRILGSGLGLAAVIAAFGAAMAWIFRPNGVSGAAVALAAITAGYTGGVLLIQPWRVRLATMWPMLLLGAQGAILAGVLIVGLLLYSATRPDPLVFGLVVTAGFTASVLGLASVYGKVASGHQRR